MRMFVAIRPPEAVLADLESYVEPRREVDSTLRWARPEQWHLTLAFMAEVADRSLDELVERLGDTAAAGNRFELSLVGAGAFPNPARAKVLWAGVGGAADQLSHLAGNVRSACARAGVVVEGGAYRPHLTLARLSRPIDVTRWLRVFDLYRSATWSAQDIVLYRSQLGTGPAQHHVVAEFPLGDGAG